MCKLVKIKFFAAYILIQGRYFIVFFIFFIIGFSNLNIVVFPFNGYF